MKLKKIASFLALAGSLFASGYAWASGYYYEYEYYSDASYTNQVGGKILECNGKMYKWGNISTPYKLIVDTYSCDRAIP